MITRKRWKECEVTYSGSYFSLQNHFLTHIHVGIFAQASKSLDEYRATITSQKDQITSLEESSSNFEQKLKEVQVELDMTKGKNWSTWLTCS
jgi:hypothetical protein